MRELGCNYMLVDRGDLVNNGLLSADHGSW